jgi:hypothetical protein
MTSMVVGIALCASPGGSSGEKPAAVSCLNQAGANILIESAAPGSHRINNPPGVTRITGWAKAAGRC